MGLLLTRALEKEPICGQISMEDRLEWLEAEIIKQQHNNAVEAEKRLKTDPAAARREYKRDWMRKARHPKPEPVAMKPMKIGNRWRLVKDLPLRDDQVAGDASKGAMAALASRVAPTLKIVPLSKRTMAPQAIDKYGKLR